MGPVKSTLASWAGQSSHEKPPDGVQEKPEESWLEYLTSFFKSRLESQSLGRDDTGTNENVDGSAGKQEDQTTAPMKTLHPNEESVNNADAVGAVKELDDGEEEEEEEEEGDYMEGWEEYEVQGEDDEEKKKDKGGGNEEEGDGKAGGGDDEEDDQHKGDELQDEHQYETEEKHEEKGVHAEDEENVEEENKDKSEEVNELKEEEQEDARVRADDEDPEKQSEGEDKKVVAAAVVETEAEEEKSEDQAQDQAQDQAHEQEQEQEQEKAIGRIRGILGRTRRQKRAPVEEVVQTEIENGEGVDGDLDLEEGRHIPTPPPQPKGAEEGVDVEVGGTEAAALEERKKNAQLAGVPVRDGSSAFCGCLPLSFGGGSIGAGTGDIGTSGAVEALSMEQSDPAKQKMREEMTVDEQRIVVNRVGASNVLSMDLFEDYHGVGETANAEEGGEAKVDSKAEEQKRGELKRHTFYMINTVHLFAIVSLNSYMFNGELVGFARVLLLDASDLFETIPYKEGLAWSLVLFFWLYYLYLTALRFMHHLAEDIYNMHHVWNIILGLGSIALSAYLFLSAGWCKKGDNDCVTANLYYGSVILIFPISVFFVWVYFFFFRGFRLYGRLGCGKCCAKGSYNPLETSDYSQIKQSLHCWTVATYQVMTYVLFAAATVAFAEVYDAGSTAQQAGACFGIGLYIALIWLLTIEPKFSAQFQDAVHFYKPLFKERAMCAMEVWYLFYIFVFLLEKVILVWLVVTLGAAGEDKGRDAGIGCAIVIVVWTVFTLFIPYNVDDDKSKACWSVFCGEGQEMRLNGRFLDVAGRIVTLCYIGFALASAQSDAALVPLFKALSCLFYIGLFAFWFRYLVAINVKSFCRYDVSKSLEVRVETGTKNEEIAGAVAEELPGDDTKPENAETTEDGEEKQGEGEAEGVGQEKEKDKENAEKAPSGEGDNGQAEGEQKTDGDAKV